MTKYTDFNIKSRFCNTYRKNYLKTLEHNRRAAGRKTNVYILLLSNVFLIALQKCDESSLLVLTDGQVCQNHRPQISDINQYAHPMSIRSTNSIQ